MTGTTGLFTKKIIVRAYVDNAGGLRVGAPVRLEGVDIGNVTGIRVVRDPKAPACAGRSDDEDHYQVLRHDADRLSGLAQYGGRAGRGFR